MRAEFSRSMMPKPLVAIPEKQLPQFRRRLLAWFQREKRDLEWRRTRDPYRIWISEIMLQQTRVAAVTPYYLRFLERFPTVSDLARAREDAVLHAWAGLGYYSRARNLRRAAQEIVAQHAGQFPEELEATLALPGIGLYTASAVLSIAYGKPHAVLDGNVARVLARLGAIRGDLRRPQIWRRLQETAGHLLASKDAGDWNQAMMELGATVCTPRAPRCGACPVSRWCRARERGIQDQLPSARRTAKPVRLTLAAAVLLDPRGRTLLVRQGEASPRDGAAPKQGTAFFSRLWQFPALDVSTAAGRAGSRPAGRAGNPPANPPVNKNASNGIEAHLARHLADTLGLPAVTLRPAGTARHAVTFHDIRLLPFLARVERLPAVPGSRTPKLSEFGPLAVSSATRKIATAALACL
jgi:A/G-specific adenine glycosylase